MTREGSRRVNAQCRSKTRSGVRLDRRRHVAPLKHPSIALAAQLAVGDPDAESLGPGKRRTQRRRSRRRARESRCQALCRRLNRGNRRERTSRDRHDKRMDRRSRAAIVLSTGTEPQPDRVRRRRRLEPSGQSRACARQSCVLAAVSPANRAQQRFWAPMCGPPPAYGDGTLRGYSDGAPRRYRNGALRGDGVLRGGLQAGGSSHPRKASRLRVDSPRLRRHSHSFRIDVAKPSSRIVLNDSSA